MGTPTPKSESLTSHTSWGNPNLALVLGDRQAWQLFIQAIEIPDLPVTGVLFCSFPRLCRKFLRESVSLCATRAYQPKGSRGLP
jgi:hypothetical protein